MEIEFSQVREQIVKEVSTMNEGEKGLLFITCKVDDETSPDDVVNLDAEPNVIIGGSTDGQVMGLAILIQACSDLWGMKPEEVCSYMLDIIEGHDIDRFRNGDANVGAVQN